jgi:hypothetical protein
MHNRIDFFSKTGDIIRRFYFGKSKQAMPASNKLEWIGSLGVHSLTVWHLLMRRLEICSTSKASSAKLKPLKQMTSIKRASNGIENYTGQQRRFR